LCFRTGEVVAEGEECEERGPRDIWNCGEGERGIRKEWEREGEGEGGGEGVRGGDSRGGGGVMTVEVPLCLLQYILL
jgi:hypothetical protein